MSTQVLAAGKSSIHGELLEQLTPAWLIEATPARRSALKASSIRLPDWYRSASIKQQTALRDSFHASFTAQTRLDKTMSTLQDIDTFAALLLIKALKDRFGVEADVNKTYVCLRRPLAIGALEIEVSTFEVMKLSLLQAALHNFEASECEQGAYHAQSGFVVETSTPGVFEAVAVNVTVRQLLTLCRTLDIGQQYQTYLKTFFQSADAKAEDTLRQQFIASQKAALRSAADIAVLKKDIEPKDHEMILSVINGENHPRQGNKQVWFRDLSLMKRRMTGCVVFGICEKYRYTDEFIVYVPHDPEHPLKRYTPAQMREEFKRQFTVPDKSLPEAAAPSGHQRFFSQFVAYADRPYYFSQFTRETVDAPTDPLRSIWVKVAQLIPLVSNVSRIKELPPERQGKREPEDNPYLNPVEILHKGSAGIWADNVDLWAYLYEQNRDKVIADARSHAAPTADVDAKVRVEKLNHLLEIGMLGLNMVSMFVPVLGEIMMTVMAAQLLYESFEGAIEWSEGDRIAAKAHLVDVAENLALIAVMAGVGHGFGKLAAVKPEPVIEGLEPFKRSNGDNRLWKPDLKAYESDVVLSRDTIPDAQGRFRVKGKTYIRQSGKVYEKAYDGSLKKWRIKHPTDAHAWQPILEHNGHGAWRHTYERPLQWDRLTLLRRIGHSTDALTDEQLLKIADGCAVDDNVLRKMHVDHLPPPPELADALGLFAADPEGAQIIEHAASRQAIDRLQRECPGLSRFAAQRVLLDANVEELARLKTTRRTPLRMLEQARWYAQRGRQSRAFVDLQTHRMVSADSKWLALHALEELPGWSDEVRLEIRDGHVEGPLIDAIGSETAASRKYLVKNGPAYQAFDERGEALNSVPRNGDNFFSSIMHALPDESRQTLGLPHVGQSGDLQRAVIDSAVEHRAELAQRLEQRFSGNKAFKPPVRVTERTVGYYASGRGQGLHPSLVTRVQDVYPGLTDQQAHGFILNQLRAGKTDAQIFGLLQSRLREWELLESTLDQWVGESAPESVLQSMLGGRPSVARNIKECWRNAPLAGEQLRFRWLDLTCDDPLPPLSADFSHVRELSLRGRFINDASIDALLGYFPELEGLGVNATGSGFTNVPQKLGAMPRLTKLSLYSAEPFAEQMPTQLSQLTNLEELNVYTPGFTPMALDLSRMRNLRRLGITAKGLLEWPVGVIDLPNLVRLDLKGTGISSLPRALFEGHEPLWSGLSLEWSNFSREEFKPAYEYVKNHPEHLVDLEEMVRGYSEAELARLAEGVGGAFHAVPDSFFAQWQGAQARFEAVEALSEQHRLLDLQLNRWTGQGIQAGLDFDEVIKRSMATIAIRTSWRNGAFKRYTSMADVSVLELPKLQLRALPELSAGAFNHVKTLYLTGTRATAEELQGFVRGFTELQTLDLSGNGLTEVPIAPGDLAKLTRLDLSGNQIVVSPGVQQAFDGLSALESLDLSHNPLNSLDVSGMERLQALNLQATGLHEWPAGAQDLPQLNWLDLRNSKISALPEAVLENDVLIKVDLTGTPLTPQAVSALKAARQRIEIAKGLPAGTLETFALEPVPSAFPPAESGYSIARHLLPLSQVPAGEGAGNFSQRLQRLNPSLADDDALQVIEQIRGSGATDPQINARLAGWEHTFESMTRRLNGWLFTRQSRGAGWVMSSESRRLGALRILECWREGLTVADGVTDSVLNLNGLQLGDLPELPLEFSHVGTLNLTGIRISPHGSDGFLKAFTQVKRLELNGNDLETVPEPVLYMDKLERLELSANRLSDAEHRFASLNRLERLTWLDLGYNDLDAFDIAIFERLETLDLRNNNLTEWPEGVLDASQLRTMNLSGNDISSIPPLAFDGSHDVLLAGTDLSDNYNLSRESLERLRDYRESSASETVLGLSRSDLDDLIEEANGEGESESSSIEPDEVLPEAEVGPEELAPWLANGSSEELASKTRIWNQLAAEPDNTAFFHLLSRLQDTQEFRVANADLTRRVWMVLDAAASNSELRKILFDSSSSHGTCVDGRILTFSGLESKVFLHNALLDVPAGRLSVKGAPLLTLSRQLFRLDKVDELAIKAARHAGQDQAEVRLGYRIGLTGGWSDGLELPGQPKHMTYASGVTRTQLDEVRLAVINAERGDGFFEDLIQRDYWKDYLEEKYPDVFRALDEAEAGETIEDETMSADDPVYVNRLVNNQVARNEKLIELSRKEVAEIESTASAAGPSMTT
jgi:Leucine-rich repeat (LRR) protein